MPIVYIGGMATFILLTANDLRRRWEVSVTTANRWANEKGFPKPARSLKMRPREWRITDIVKWERTRLR